MNLLDHALWYHDLGWCVIPTKPGTKKPACRSWQPYQTERADKAQLRRWFKDGKKSLAIVSGPVSGGLVVRDFDDLDSYDSWAREHPTLANSLPTVETGRPGRHVYFKTGKKFRIINVGDGEFRGAGYCLAPPSIHPSGTSYRWLVEPSDSIPFIEDPVLDGLLPRNREFREDGDDGEDSGGTRGHTTLREGSDKSDRSLLSDEDSELIRQAIGRCLPEGQATRHRLIFELARELKAIPALADVPVQKLEPVMRHWHKAAKPFIKTKPFEESWIDFCEGWERVKYPKGEEPITQIFVRAMAKEIPREAVKYEQKGVKSLASFCRELQREHGESPFFLAVRTAGDLLETDPGTASRWLRILRLDGILKLESEGSQKSRKASRYRYVASLD